jgi:hypothetical protein
MGNPHAVVFVPDLDALPFDTVGPLFECASVFPKKINTEFVQVLSRGEPPPPCCPGARLHVSTHHAATSATAVQPRSTDTLPPR